MVEVKGGATKGQGGSIDPSVFLKKKLYAKIFKIIKTIYILVKLEKNHKKIIA